MKNSRYPFPKATLDDGRTGYILNDASGREIFVAEDDPVLFDHQKSGGRPDADDALAKNLFTSRDHSPENGC